MALNDIQDMPNPGRDPERLTNWRNWKRLRLWFKDAYYTAGYGSFTALISDLGSRTVTVYVNSAVSITSNLTIPSNISIVVLRGGSFAISTGVTLTFNGSFEAGLFRVFTWTGTGVVRFGYASAYSIAVEWFGALADYYGGAQTDNTAYIQAALDAAFGGTGEVRLARGGYLLTSELTYPQRNVTLRGVLGGTGLVWQRTTFGPAIAIDTEGEGYVRIKDFEIVGTEKVSYAILAEAMNEESEIDISVRECLGVCDIKSTYLADINIRAQCSEQTTWSPVRLGSITPAEWLEVYGERRAPVMLQSVNACDRITVKTYRIGSEAVAITYAGTSDAGADTISKSVDTSVATDDRIQFTTAPGGLDTVTSYYAVNPTATTFQVALTSGGVPIDITSSVAVVWAKPPQKGYAIMRIVSGVGSVLSGCNFEWGVDKPAYTDLSGVSPVINLVTQKVIAVDAALVEFVGTNIEGHLCENLIVASRFSNVAFHSLNDYSNYCTGDRFINQSGHDQAIKGYQAYDVRSGGQLFKGIDAGLSASQNWITERINHSCGLRYKQTIANGGPNDDPENVIDTFAFSGNEKHGTAEADQRLFNMDRIVLPRVLTGYAVTQGNMTNTAGNQYTGSSQPLSVGDYINVSCGVLIREDGQYYDNKLGTGNSSTTGLAVINRLRPSTASKWYRVFVGRGGQAYLVKYDADPVAEPEGNWLAGFATDASNLITGLADNPRMTSYSGVYIPHTTSVIIYASTTPTTGYWRVGSLCFDNNATSATTSGWICTTAGTPGTWTAFDDFTAKSLAAINLNLSGVLQRGGTQILTAQQTGMGATLGAATAGASYTAAEQTMLQAVYNKMVSMETKLKTHGLIAT